jgi:RING-box protein 1
MDSGPAEKRQRTTRASSRAGAIPCIAAPAADETTCPALEKDQPFLKVKKWQAVAVWSWNVVTDTCAICRNNLHEPSIDVQALGTAQVEKEHPGLSIAWGGCGHIFHLDCIKRWLRTRSVCPLCNRSWEMTKVEQIHGYALME